MTIDYSNQINYTGNAYLDANMMPVQTYSDLLKYPINKRFIGLEIVVLHDEVNSEGNQARYWLNGGINNSNWEKKAEKLLDSTISSESNTLSITIEEKKGVLNKLDVNATGLATKSDINTLNQKISANTQNIQELDLTLSETANYLETHKQNKLIAGENIVISGDTISSTTKSELQNDLKTTITVGYLEQYTTLQSGTSFEEIFKKILTKELYPNAATKPYLLASGYINLGVIIIGSNKQIPTVTLNTNNGKFNASYTTPSQPTVQGVTWTNKNISGVINNGFNGSTITSGETQATTTNGIIQLGTNKITYTLNGHYSRPSNMPISNLSNKTLSTNTINTNWDGDISAVWEQANAQTVTVYTTATGVYPIYTNFDFTTGDIDDSLLNIEHNIGDVTSYDTSITIDEVTNNKNIKIDIPTGRDITGLYAYNPMAQTWNLQDASTYQIITDGSITHTINGTTYNYIRLIRTPQTGTITYTKSRWKITFNKGLSK